MDELTEILIVIGMFALRLGVPVGLTVAIGYLLRRLDSRWEAEARARPEVIRRHRAAAAQRPCWEERGCTESEKSRCAACQHTDIPCWLARLRSERRLPATCPECARYGLTVSVADGADVALLGN